MLKKLESKNFLDSVVRGGGTNAEKNRVQEILGLCCFKKLVILRGGPVKRTTLYITMKSYPRHTMKFYQWQEFFPFTMKQTNNLL